MCGGVIAISIFDLSTGSPAYVLARKEQELDLENVAFSTPVQPPGTLFLSTFTTLLIPVHSENDSRVHFLIVLIIDARRRVV